MYTALGILGTARPLGMSGGNPSWLPLDATNNPPLVYPDFANSNYWYSNTIYGSFTGWMSAIGGVFSRASTGYADDTSGNWFSFSNNIARITNKGIRLEGARTNDLLWCRDMTNAAWSKVNMTAGLSQVGIDGTANSASLIMATAGNGTILQTLTLGLSTDTYSVWLKRITGSGTVNISGDGLSWTAVAVTATWTRFQVTAALTNPVCGLQIVTNGDAVAADFNMLEPAVSFASSPILTTTVAVTRAADSLIIGPTGGVPFTGFSTSAGTVIFGLGSALPTPSATERFFQFNTGNASDYIDLYMDGSNGAHSLLGGGTLNWTGDPSAAGKYGLAFATGNNAFSLRGGAAQANAQALTISDDRLIIGASNGSSAQLFGNVSSFAYWPSRLSNADLQRLST